MNDPEDDEKRAELISRMFALLTAKLEDGAATAAECQERRPPDQLRQGAVELEALIGGMTTIAAAVSALLR